MRFRTPFDAHLEHQIKPISPPLAEKFSVEEKR